MARPKPPPKKKPKRRLNLEMSEKVSDRLENLKKVTDADSLSEVIRKSVAVYDHLWNEKSRKNAEVIVRLPDGTEEKLVLL